MADFLSAKRQELEQELVRQRESAGSSRTHKFMIRQLTAHRNKLRRRQEKQARPDGSQVRPLGVLEYFMYKIGGCVMWLVVDLESSIDLEATSSTLFRSGVAATIRRHSTLRAQIDDKKQMVAPTYEEFMRQNPDFVIEAPDDDPFDLVERELAKGDLARPMGLPRLWNMWLTGRGGVKRSLVVLINHCLMDGFSLALWLNEIGYNANALVEEGVTEESSKALLDKVEQLPLPVPFEQHISWWPERKLRALSMQWAFQRVAFAMKKPVLPKPAKSSTKRRTQVITHSMTEEETRRIISTVKSQNTTVAGAVGAAALLAIQQMVDRDMEKVDDGHKKKNKKGKGRNYLMQVNICLRMNAIKRGSFDAVEEMSQMSVPLNQVVCPDKLGGMWETARKIRANIRQAVKTGEYFETIKEMAYCKATSSFTFPIVVKNLVENQDGRYCALNVISLGDLDDVAPQPEGPVQGVHAYAGIDVSAFGPYLTVTCMTLGGKLTLALSTAEPLVTSEQAREMLDRIVREMKSGAAEDEEVVDEKDEVVSLPATTTSTTASSSPERPTIITTTTTTTAAITTKIQEAEGEKARWW